MDSPGKILRKYGIRSKRAFGQCFLTDEGYLSKIADLAALSQDDVVLEIGAGIGNLTRVLAPRAKKVIALEFDRDMITVLEGEIKAENVQILAADALKVDFPKLAGKEKLKVIGNLPYNIATEVIFRLLDARKVFSTLLLMLQLEVARRIVSPAGSRDYGILSVLCGLYAETSLKLTLKREAFYPRPKVESGLVEFTLSDSPRVKIENEDFFKSVVRGAFSQRRKTILNSMAGYPSLGRDKDAIRDALAKAGIDPRRRAETLTLAEFASLARNF